MDNNNGTWDLSDIQLNDGVIKAREASDRAAAHAAALDYSSKDWTEQALNALELIDNAMLLQAETSAHALMAFMTDVSNTEASLALEAMNSVNSRIAGTVSRFSKAVRLSGCAEEMSENPVFREYSYFFMRLADEERHALAEQAEEAVYAMQQAGGHVFSALRGQTEAMMIAETEVDGIKEIMPVTSVRNLASSPSAALRLAGFKADTAAGEKARDVFAACFNGVKGEAVAISRLRRYDSVLDWMLFISGMKRATLEAMNEAVTDALPGIRRYIKAKAALLGHSDGLPYYDLYAPAAANAPSFTFERAGEYLTDTFSGFSPEMGSFVSENFKKRRVDAFPRSGRQGGAMCIPLPLSKESRVFVNFDGSFHGVVNLAHELGHAWHDRLTFHVPALMRDAPTPICETASSFNEAVVFESALRDAEGPDKMFFLDALLSGAVRNIVEMRARFCFEERALKLRERGRLSPDELCDIMLWAQKEAFGDSIAPNTLHPYLWINKVHYYIPNFHYYSFPYTFGLLLAQGLYGMSSTPGFEQSYSAFLAASCTASAEDAARIAGVDICGKAFWEGALQSFVQRADEFERMAACAAKTAEFHKIKTS